MRDSNHEIGQGSVFILALEGFRLVYDAERHAVVSELDVDPVEESSGAGADRMEI